MGFLSTLMDIMTKLVDSSANQINRTSDEELENKSFNRVMKTGNIDDYKTADEQREQANEMVEKLNDNFNRWLYKSSVDELKKGLNTFKYNIRSDSDNNYEREQRLRQQIWQLEQEERYKQAAAKKDNNK